MAVMMPLQNFLKGSRILSFSISGWRIDNVLFSGIKKSVDMLKGQASYGNFGNQNVAVTIPIFQH
jgi:hypothetical protein